MTKNNACSCPKNATIAKSVIRVQFGALRRLLLLLLLIGLEPAMAAGLSLSDQQQASELAALVAWPSAQSGNTHTLGLQTLSIEKQEQKNAHGVRMVRVYQYHYAYQSARLLVFDLLDQALVREHIIDAIHLPLNQVEIDRAVTIVANTTEVVELLRAEQRHRNRPEFIKLSELDIKASIYEPTDPLHPCSKQRCALLSLFDDTRTVFSIEPVVYLGAARLELLTQ